MSSVLNLYKRRVYIAISLKSNHIVSHIVVLFVNLRVVLLASLVVAPLKSPLVRLVVAPLASDKPTLNTCVEKQVPRTNQHIQRSG